MDKKKQTMRFTDSELSIIKNTFADNDDLIFALRKHFLQLDMTLSDIDLLQTIVKSNRDVQKVIRKAFLPEIDGTAPIHQIIDLWMTVDIKDKTPSQIVANLKARELLIRYINQQLNLLEGIKVAKTTMIKLDKMLYKSYKSEIEAYTDITARNTAITHTEQQLSQFIILAGRKDETVEESKERLFQNSTK